jgi:multidrug efflux pump
LKDVARVELGTKSYAVQSSLNGKPGGPDRGLSAAGANALSTMEALRHPSGRAEELVPGRVSTTRIPYDTTKFIQVSIEEVIHTFFEAIVLVMIVVFLFLQNWRATLIPVIAVPISIIGTFAGMYMLGFSINLLTLFGLVLAIGIVVDDAIVVLENVERLMTSKSCRRSDAAIKAMGEVTGPVVAIVLVLCSVFVPVSFMGGLAGADVQAVCRHDRHLGDSVGHRGVDADAGPVRLILKPGHHEPACRSASSTVLRPADGGATPRAFGSSSSASPSACCWLPGCSAPPATCSTPFRARWFRTRTRAGSCRSPSCRRRPRCRVPSGDGSGGHQHQEASRRRGRLRRLRL